MYALFPPPFVIISSTSCDKTTRQNTNTRTNKTATRTQEQMEWHRQDRTGRPNIHRITNLIASSRAHRRLSWRHRTLDLKCQNNDRSNKSTTSRNMDLQDLLPPNPWVMRTINELLTYMKALLQSDTGRASRGRKILSTGAFQITTASRLVR